MFRRSPIFSAVDPAVVSSGLAPDVQKVLAPLWVSAAGVEFIAGSVRHRRVGQKMLHPVDGLCRGMGQQVLSNGEKVLWFSIGSRVMRWDFFSINEVAQISPASLLSPYLDFTFFGDWVYINTGKDQIHRWANASFDFVPEMPSDVARLMKYMSFLLAVGTGPKGTGVEWSDNRDVSKWVEAADNTAGALFFDELSSPILSGAILDKNIALYSANAMSQMTYIGEPFYFGQREGLRDIGLVSRTALTSTGSLNYGVSRQGPWRTDGLEVQYIDGGRMHKYFQDHVNWAQANKCLLVRNDVLRTIEFYFPSEDSEEINEGWCFDPGTGGWSPIPAVSFFSENMVFGLPLAVNTEGEVFKVGARDFNYDPLLLETKPLVMQVATSLGWTDVHYSTRVDEIELFLKETQNVLMFVGSSQESAGPVTWSAAIPLDINKSTYTVPSGIPSAPFWHLRFTSTTNFEQVYEDAEQVVEGDDIITAITGAVAWKLDLQGFLLFGDVEGGKAS